MSKVQIRAATQNDVPLILSFIQQLADYERLRDKCVATEDVSRQSLFGKRRHAEVIIDRLCITLGFCLPPNAIRHLKENTPADIKGFTNAVFVAEGLDPSTADRHLYRQVQAMVAKAFRQSERERS